MRHPLYSPPFSPLKLNSAPVFPDIEYYWRPPYIGNPHGRLAGDPQILVGDPHIFIGDPHILIKDPHIFNGDPQMFVSNENLGVFNENLGVSSENVGVVSHENLESTMRRPWGCLIVLQ